MKILELFSGTKSISHVFKERGHETFTVDNNSDLNPDLCIDIRDFRPSDCPFVPDVIWASPPCTAFSVARIGKNWNMDGTPKTDGARLGIELLKKTLEIIQELNPRFFFIENPRGMMRKMPCMGENFSRHTVSYCQYGDTRQKPTDIWTNSAWTPRPMCKPGASCHEAAPRGSRTGTQGMKNATERGMIPTELCREVCIHLEKQTNETIRNKR